MLLGVAVGVIREPGRYRRWLWVVCAGAGVIGLINTTADVLSESSGTPVKVAPVLEALGSHVPLALAYAAGLLAWRRPARSDAWTRPVAAAGRMALSNYLAQSLVFGAVFYGYGFGLFGRLAPAPRLRSALRFTRASCGSASGGCADIFSDPSNGCGAR